MRPYYIIDDKFIDKLKDNEHQYCIGLSANPSFYIIDFLELNPEFISYIGLSYNKNASHLIKKYLIDIGKYGDKTIINKYSQFENGIDWYKISENTGMISIIEDNLYKIDWGSLCINHNATHLIENNLDIINNMNGKYDYPWYDISSNPNAMKLLKNNINKINCEGLAKNPNLEALEIMNNILKKLDLSWIVRSLFCSNKNPLAIEIIRNNLIKFDDCWFEISKNPNAIKLLEENFDKINWSGLCYNYNAIHILEKNQDKIIDYELLLFNKNAGNLIKNNLEKINWNIYRKRWIDFYIDEDAVENNYEYIPKDIVIIDSYFFSNQYLIRKIIQLDYNKMKLENSIFTEELISYVFNPNRLLKLCEQYNLTFEEINDIY